MSVGIHPPVLPVFGTAFGTGFGNVATQSGSAFGVFPVAPGTGIQTVTPINNFVQAAPLTMFPSNTPGAPVSFSPFVTSTGTMPISAFVAGSVAPVGASTPGTVTPITAFTPGFTTPISNLLTTTPTTTTVATPVSPLTTFGPGTTAVITPVGGGVSFVNGPLTANPAFGTGTTTIVPPSVPLGVVRGTNPPFVSSGMATIFASPTITTPTLRPITPQVFSIGNQSPVFMNSGFGQVRGMFPPPVSSGMFTIF